MHVFRRSVALFVALALTTGALFAANSYTGKEGPLELDEFLLLETERAERSHLDLSVTTSGVKRYSKGYLPSDLDVSPKMYTFKTTFRIDPPLKDDDLSLYMGLAEYPFRLYLNGVEIFMKGRYRDGHYNSSLRAVQSVYLSPDLLKYGAEENELVLEIFPQYETWGLDRLYIDHSADVARAVFLRNFVGINAIQGGFFLALILGLYFLGLFFAERRKEVKYLIFCFICAAFCMAYFSVVTHYESNDEVLMEALSKGGIVLMSAALLMFCCEFTGILNEKRIFPLVMLGLGIVAAASVLAQGSKEEILRWFGYAMNFIIVPQLILDIGILIYALIRNKNLYVIFLLSSFPVIIATAIHDVIYLNAAVIPFAWFTAYGYFAVVIAIFAMLALEQANLYHHSLQQTADLIIDQSRIAALNEELVRQKDSFFRFVPTQFLQLLGRDSAVDIQLGDSSLRFLSILFSDIRQFTALSEGMLPGENFEFLNSYLFRMEKAIQRNQGFVDKYIGDAIMALFASSDGKEPTGKSFTADAAMIAAIEMRRELDGFNRYLAEQGFPPIEIGVGVNTGEVMLGTVGSESRLDTTVIGDSVNLSSRLENLTKFYRSSTLVSEQTVHSLVRPERFAFRMVDHVVVPGRVKPLMIYELLDLENPGDAVKREYGDQFDLAISLYLARSFNEALAIFTSLQGRNEGDFLPRLFAERCAAYLKAPPEDSWDGVFRIRKKDFATD